MHERESKNTVVRNRALSFSWQVWFSESFAADSSTTFFALSLKTLVVFWGGYYLARLALAEKRPKCELILLLLYFDVCTTYGPYSHVFMSIKGKLLHVLVTLLTFFPAVAEKKTKHCVLIVRWYVFVYFFYILNNWYLNQRYTYRVLQTIQMKLTLLWVWAELKLLWNSSMKFK